MDSALKVWKLIGQSLERNFPVMLLYVLESRGSSPGRQGFLMAVTADGEMEGSIGGGVMEHKFTELAKKQLAEISAGTGAGLSPGSVRKQIHDKTAGENQSGMICSGEQTLLLYPVQPKDGGAVRDIIRSLEHFENGTLGLSRQGISFSPGLPSNNYYFSMLSENDWEFREKTGYKNELFIIGGGHCSRALSRLMRSMDFYIRVYEERNGLKTLEENEWAHEKIMLTGYSELSRLIAPGPGRYVVIMTFGYRTDDIALRALLGKDFTYTGMLGSAGKMKKLMKEYRDAGIDESLLKKIHSPAGLSIKSRTPEEIAVSIAAEIIREKNRELP